LLFNARKYFQIKSTNVYIMRSYGLWKKKFQEDYIWQ